MIIYNVTISIDPEAEKKWVNWMQKEHIPQVLATQCFIEARFCRVHGEEEGGKTYAITYLCQSEDMLQTYQEKFAAKLQQETQKHFGGKFAAFRTNLSVLDIFKP
jgi:hypothetical protein